MEWINFIFCAVLGWTGIHKFKERKVIAGMIYFLSGGLCGIGWIADTVHYLIVAIKRTREIKKARSKRLTDWEKLPLIEEPELLDQRHGEVCYYEQNAALIAPTAVSQTRVDGMVSSIGTEMTLPVKKLSVKRINWAKAEEMLGRLYVTNQRIVITDGQQKVACPLQKLQKIVVYRNLLIVMMQERMVYIATDEAVYVYQMVSACVNLSDEDFFARASEAMRQLCDLVENGEMK